MSTGLRDTQQWMLNALVHPTGTEAALADTMIVTSPKLSARDQLAIYQRSYYSRLITCMAEQFPALGHALGAQLFAGFAREYLEAEPSDSYTLHELGRRFPGHLQATRPDRDGPPESWINFMVDLATFERQLFVLFDAPGAEGQPPPTPDTSDDDLRLQPAFALGSYRFPVSRYYHDVQLGRSPELPDRFDSHVALVRVNYRTHTYPISAAQHGFLQHLHSGESMEVALDALGASLDMTSQAVRQSWSSTTGVRNKWIAAGFFVESSETS